MSDNIHDVIKRFKNQSNDILIININTLCITMCNLLCIVE